MNIKLFVLLILSSLYVHAEPIEDNSFLIEEAYNQEAGVVQFINSFQYLKKSKDWVYTFTNEIPIGSQAHQFSYTIPYQRVDANQSSGVGDILLNYRFQLLNEGPIAMAPRLSLVIPSGKYEDGLGQGGYGLQFNHAVSLKIHNNFANHWNLGFTWLPEGKDSAGNKSSTSTFNYGTSVIYLLSDSLNFLTEVVGTSTELVSGTNQTTRTDTLFIVPGLRYAFDLHEWQVVPGIGFPVGLGGSERESGLLAYLSIEGKMF